MCEIFLSVFIKKKKNEQEAFRICILFSDEKKKEQSAEKIENIPKKKKNILIEMNKS